MKVRTRFAPSPTGFLHAGNVRSALFPWLVAKQNNGQFILRIEDTDQARETAGAVEDIEKTLDWLGIEWDEGPDKGGPFAPYTQTARLDNYHKWAQKLVDEGKAYADTRTPEELDDLRADAKAKNKPFLARDYRPDTPPAWKLGMPLRFKSTPKPYEWHDEIMGDLSAGPESVDDFIMLKSDGLPTYNFAHIIDDQEMEITHVIRGLEYLSSMPKYLALYEALDFPVPVLAHMPHVLALDGKKKLSKRDGAMSILDYRHKGYLPEAMLNFLASLGWNDGSEQEIFTKEELIDKFGLDKVQRSGAIFDEHRLEWMNGAWIRRLDIDDLYERVDQGGWWPQGNASNSSKDYKKAVLALVQEHLKYLSELPELTDFFFEDRPADMSLIDNNKQLKDFDHNQLKDLLSKSRERVEQSDFSVESLTKTLNDLLQETGQRPGVLFSLIRIVTTWAPASPGLAETLQLLGKEKSLARLKSAIDLLDA